MFHSRISVVVIFSLFVGCGGNPPTPPVQSQKANTPDPVQPAPANTQKRPTLATESSAKGARPKYDIPGNLRPYEVKSDFPLMTAEQIAKEFTTDEAAAKAKYQDKAVYLTGTVAAIDKSEMGGVNLILKGVQAANGEFNVNCGIALLDRYSKVRSEIIKVGDPVTLFGDVYIFSFDTEPLSDVTVVTCFIVEQP